MAMKRREFIQFFALTAAGALSPLPAFPRHQLFETAASGVDGLWLRVVEENGVKQGFYSHDSPWTPVDEIAWTRSASKEMLEGFYRTNWSTWRTCDGVEEQARGYWVRPELNLLPGA